MKYLKYTAYVYLAAAVFFAVHGISELQTKQDSSWLSFFLAAMSVFMFFFRRRFNQKMAEREQNQNISENK